jgi:TonB family protein
VKTVPKILVATDGFRGGRAAVRFAARLAGTMRSARVHAILIATTLRNSILGTSGVPFPNTALTEMEREEKRRAETILAVAAREFRKRGLRRDRMKARGSRGAVAAFSLAAALSATGFEPPRWRSGPLPHIPQQTAAWGQSLLEASVSAAGEVEKTTVLRFSPSFTEKLQEAVSAWRFEPARVDGRPSPIRVLVGAVFRPPTLPDAPGLGEPPRDVAEPSDSVPFPTSIVAPLYPPRALGDGVALLEVMVGGDGNVRTATVLRSAPGFDDSALQAALQWKFRPARRQGSPVPARVVLVFAFRQPIVSKSHPD